MARAKRKKSGATFGSRTDVGCVREHNEDSLAVAPPLYVVCDGMGGHAAGEVASEIAVDVICDRAPAHPDASALGQAVEEANLAIIRAAAKASDVPAWAVPAPPPYWRRISSSSPRWATRGPISCTRGRCSSSPATTRLWPTLSRPGKLPRPRPGCIPSARSSPALWAATRAPSPTCSKSPWKPATACFCAPMAFPPCWKMTKSPRSSPTTASLSAAPLSW